jgi:hypothetical protein
MQEATKLCLMSSLIGTILFRMPNSSNNNSRRNLFHRIN